ncbi:MAG: hypothetical protein HWN51_05100 [Desulfobacterales bacterium]|nr:hypothetical protein [Desulfobacterales bacterium]
MMEFTLTCPTIARVLAAQLYAVRGDGRRGEWNLSMIRHPGSGIII